MGACLVGVTDVRTFYMVTRVPEERGKARGPERSGARSGGLPAPEVSG